MNQETTQRSTERAAIDIAGSQPEELLKRIEELTSVVQANERKQRVQQAVFRIAKIASDAEDMDTFYTALHNIVKELTSTDAFFIALYHEKEAALSFPYYEDQYDDEQTEDETPLKKPWLDSD